MKDLVINVGFDNLKMHQGIYLDKQTKKEEIFFVKTAFNSCIKFYDLTGKQVDSISLKKAEQELGRINRVSIMSKDSIIVFSATSNKIVCVNRNEKCLFRYSLDSLTKNINDKYKFWGSLLPTSIMFHDKLILATFWEANKIDYKNGIVSKFTSDYEFFSYFYKYFIRSSQLCNIESLFSGSPKVKFGLKNFYYNKSHQLKPYLLGSRYSIVNDKLFYINVFDRNLYDIDVNSMKILDTIRIIPDQYKIPQSIEYTKKNSSMNIASVEQESIKRNCYISNILYNGKSKEYLVFIKTGQDYSNVDELGYKFKIVVYNESFKKKKELDFKSTDYAPHSAMMTSKGILIEKILKNAYGKRSFEFFNL